MERMKIISHTVSDGGGEGKDSITTDVKEDVRLVRPPSVEKPSQGRQDGIRKPLGAPAQLLQKADSHEIRSQLTNQHPNAGWDLFHPVQGILFPAADGSILHPVGMPKILPQREFLDGSSLHPKQTLD